MIESLSQFALENANQGVSMDSLLQIGVPIVLGLIGGAFGAWATLSRYREKVDQLEKIDSQKRLSSLEGKFEAMQAQISTLQQNSPTTYVQANSPTKLTERGEELLQDSEIKAFIDKDFQNLLRKVEQEIESLGDDVSAYDVQEASLKAIKEVEGNKSFKPIKDYAFEKGLDLINIQIVGGIYLRNKVLESMNFDLASYYESDDDGHAHKIKKSNE